MNEAKDRKEYFQAMIHGHTNTALKIEESYNLAGYPPEIVTTVLDARIDAKDEERERIVEIMLTREWDKHPSTMLGDKVRLENEIRKSLNPE